MSGRYHAAVPLSPWTSRRAAVTLAALLLVAPLAACGNDETSTPTPTSTPASPPAAGATTTSGGAPATSPATPPANMPGDLARPYRVTYAKADGALNIYGAPGETKAARTLPNPLPVAGGAASVPLVLLEKSPAADGWIEVYLPVRPNGSTGFVKAADVRTESHNFRIEVKLGAFNLKAYDGDKVILDAPIATAKGNTPTPGGLYYTNQLLQPPQQNGPYGTYAYGLSGFSDTLTEFAGGDAQLGIHGTNEPDKIGQQVSSGCIRLRNADIDKLAKVLPLGVPVLIET